MPSDCLIPVLGIYLKKKKTDLKRYLHAHIHWSIIYYTIAKIWEQPKHPSMNEWIKMHTYSRILFSYNKEGNPGMWDKKGGQ